MSTGALAFSESHERLRAGEVMVQLLGLAFEEDVALGFTDECGTGDGFGDAIAGFSWFTFLMVRTIQAPLPRLWQIFATFEPTTSSWAKFNRRYRGLALAGRSRKRRVAAALKVALLVALDH